MKLMRARTSFQKMIKSKPLKKILKRNKKMNHSEQKARQYQVKNDALLYIS